MTRGSLRAMLTSVWARLRPADHRALRLGAWIVVPALGYVFLIKPMANDLLDARARLEQARALQSRELAVLADMPRLPALRAQSLVALTDERTRLFPGADPVAASAALARYVAARAGEHRLLIQSSETRPEQVLDGGLVRLSVELRGISDLTGVIGWLHALESGSMLVRVEELRIRAAERVNATDPDADTEEVLGVSVVVTGFNLAGNTPEVVAMHIAAPGTP